MRLRRISLDEIVFCIWIIAVLCAPLKVFPLLIIRLVALVTIVFMKKIDVRNIAIPTITLVIYSFSFWGQSNYNMNFFDPFNNYMKIVAIFEIAVVCNGLYLTTHKTKKIITKAALWSVFISVITSLLYTLKDKEAIRYRGADYKYIMGFYQFYGYILLAVSLTILIGYGIQHRKNVNKLFIVLLSVIVLMFNGRLTTGLLLGLLGIFLGIYSIYAKKSKKLFFTLAILVGIFLIIKDFIAEIIIYIINSFHIQGVVQNRLLTVVEMLSTGNLVDGYGSRGKLMMRSINSFLGHPFLGIGYSNYEQATVGCHSEWTDTLGVYGILGTVLIVLCFYSITIACKKNIRDELGKKMFYLSLLLFIILGFLNPSFETPIMAVVFVLVPCMQYYFEEV